jgi:post-segregation antitoxin (ccd killing protein)
MSELSDLDIDRVAERVVAKLLPRLGGAAPTPLLTKTELAEHLRVREAQIDRFVRRGMPRETVGTVPRFDLAACRAWVAENARPRAEAASGPPPAVPSPRASVAGPSGGGAPIPGVTPIGRARTLRR